MARRSPKTSTGLKASEAAFEAALTAEGHDPDELYNYNGGHLTYLFDRLFYERYGHLSGQEDCAAESELFWALGGRAGLQRIYNQERGKKNPSTSRSRRSTGYVARKIRAHTARKNSSSRRNPGWTLTKTELSRMTVPKLKQLLMAVTNDYELDELAGMKKADLIHWILDYQGAGDLPGYGAGFTG
jgi:hypothetical protein